MVGKDLLWIPAGK